MASMDYLVAANIAIWLCFGVYLAFLGICQGKLARRLNHLEELRTEND